MSEKKSGVVHFSVGEDFGLLLMNIAQEHLLYNYNPEKALATITEGLVGCPVDLALQIIKGDIILLVDVENQNIIPTEFIPGVHDKIGYQQIDVKSFVERKYHEVLKTTDSLIAGLSDLQREISRDNYKFSIDFDYQSIFKFIAGNNEDLLDELREDERIKSIEFLIKTSKYYSEKLIELKDTLVWMQRSFGCDDEATAENLAAIQDMIIDLLSTIKDTLNLDFNTDLIEDDKVKSFIDNQIEIEKTLKSGIQPVDIMDNYSAGWLSPEGLYYGLNGEIANMLHNQIADALLEAGIVPADYEGIDPRIGIHACTPEDWLEKHGWVKIHTNNINFGGGLNYRLGGKNVYMTDTQKEIIYNYGQRCFYGLMRWGWKMEKGSAAKITLLTDEQLQKMYFDF